MTVGAPHILNDMDVTAGIQTVAQRLLGDMNKWTELVLINSLSPPYFTFDPVKAFGLPLDKQVLSSLVNVSATQVTLSAQQQLWTTGNNVVFAASSSNGILTESQVISSYDGVTLKWQNGLLNSYPQGSYLATYPAQVFQNKVLMPGQVLYLPVTQANSFVLSQNGALSDVFGSDASDPLSWSDGDLTMISGVAVLIQRIKMALGTAYGSLPQSPTFGNRFRLITGSPVSAVDWTSFTREVLLKLPEISQVTDVSLTQSGDQAYVSAKVWVYTSKAPLILVNESLTLPITK